MPFLGDINSEGIFKFMLTFKTGTFIIMNMEEEWENNNMAIKRVKLDYRPAVVKAPPVEEIEIPSSHMEELDRSIRQKVRQTEAERAASIEAAGKYTVR